MDGQKSQAKLTSSNSSLLRSSPTIRSSIHSLSSVSESTPDQEESSYDYCHDLEEPKPPSKSGSPTSGLTWERNPHIRKPSFISDFRGGFAVFRTTEQGEFHKGRCNGSGVYNYIGNGRYEGDWIDGRFYTRDTYSGEWYNRQSHGAGMQTCPDGSCYIGEFKCGVKHGLGVYHFRNGDRHDGEYFGDKIHGFGVYQFANDHCYEGSWHEGRKQGYGMYTFRNGDSRCGEWDFGNLKIPSFPLKDAVLRAVQVAIKTAEKSIHLRGVEEQVNKAVMAANRAATAARVAAVKAVQNRIDGKFCNTNF
ncbi:hypothetical protein ACH5RR_026319 [Cinchona calisaya]|uniref:Uncharacterized protein n=1 Tax=Cinchona calisaya TaxID=153742 RepID=A0ABD2Z681_9GENT